MSEAKGIKGLVGRKMTKKVKFIGNDVEISKLSVAQVMEIQEKAKDINEESDGFDLLRVVLRGGVEGGDELTDEDFENFPMDELSKLSNEIMKFSGIHQEQSGK